VLNKTPQHLFLYGSWFPGFSNFAKIESFVENPLKAYVRGSVYRSAAGFPLFVSEGADKIPGSVVRMTSPGQILTILDGFYRQSKINLHNGAFYRGETEAFAGNRAFNVYVMAFKLKALSEATPKIDGGDWQAELKRKPDVLSQITLEQKLYLERLAASKGEGLGPMDPKLYRDLLRIGVITDSNQGPRLSPSGIEVVGHLPPAEEMLH
jgi:gamma-glutamylcyclotransferase (GGCT)/AIG2-like uncharacterized protein YtfP